MIKNKKVKKIIMIVVIVIVAVFLILQLVEPFFFKIYVPNLPGNSEEYAAENVKLDENSPLNGKTIIFLGSSVTDGIGGDGTSFVEYFAEKDGVNAIKEAVPGTTLVTQDETSYIPRMETIDKNLKADAFICQLSTNDASKELPLGTISESFERSDFDTQTVAGSIEYIISYAMDTWNCPVVFYTGTKYDSENYGNMVDLLLEIQKKWDCGVINMWHDDELNDLSDEERELYIFWDGIHPTKAGYYKWWFPAMETYMIDLIGKK